MHRAVWNGGESVSLSSIVFTSTAVYQLQFDAEIYIIRMILAPIRLLAVDRVGKGSKSAMKHVSNCIGAGCLLITSIFFLFKTLKC